MTTHDTALAVSDDEAAAITRAIDRDELVKLVLDLCGIPSPMRQERRAGEFVHGWMAENGFAPRKAGLMEHRFNVIGTYGGKGDGPNLLFTSHLDTESPFYDETDQYTYRPETVADPQWLGVWLEGETFFGHAVGNDRGPMACFLMAAKALKKAGIDLSGLMYLTACPGEIGPEPAEERGGVDYLGKELGACYLMSHGGVAPDYVISAEGTDFGVNWTACGYADFRVTIYGQGVFTPLLTHPEALADHPSPLVKVAPAIEIIQRWAREYEVKHRYEGPGGTAVPKVQIGAIRGGTPQAMGAASEVCNVYVQVALTPVQTIAAVDRDLKRAFREAGFGDVKIQPYTVRHGFTADPDAVRPLRMALDHAHGRVRGGPQPISNSVYSSMWRDHNVFNMNRIPSVTMGPRRWRPSIDDLVDCTRLYAMAALALCGRAP
ncbi:peptidase M20 [Nitrospirillum viridazoti]|uniref:Peptidase M20 n=1 Tax=Nitrospirillum viridazoti CBAmc TaxID=1441467 RepID=A0A248K0I4_9PROT|nr:peptidase M20 [Nitrospirillum amazonense]ASG23918.1 peptidase M20 [Nitrospirillum amazonense CBAmc]TWB44648.1 acetylornithine deacetylase/succinyl-diaminopimelate desuccinylase-like protein [Nitrospirillum amazonense]